VADRHVNRLPFVRFEDDLAVEVRAGTAKTTPLKFLIGLKLPRRACHERASGFVLGTHLDNSDADWRPALSCVGEIDRRIEIVAAEVVNTDACATLTAMRLSFSQKLARDLHWFRLKRSAGALALFAP
jgi:hypothetical protein